MLAISFFEKSQNRLVKFRLLKEVTPGFFQTITLLLLLRDFQVRLVYEYRFFEEKHLPDVTEALQLLPRQHLSLHHNGLESLATETGSVDTSDVVRNHAPSTTSTNPRFRQVPINKQQLGGLQGEYRCWGSNP